MSVESIWVYHNRYYVGVYNYDSYLKQPASVTVTADWSISPAGPLCPLNCSGRGTCNTTGSCECDQGAAGEACQSDLQPLPLGGSVTGTLAPGRWVFYDIFLESATGQRYALCAMVCCQRGHNTQQQNRRPVWDDGLLVTFHTTGGHPLVVAAHNRLPSLGSRDIYFTWHKLWTGEQRFYVKPHELQPGRWMLGIFNMDYYERTSFDYYLSVDTANITGRVLSPFASVGFGVTASLFLFAMFSVFRRILWERHVARYGPVVGTRQQQQRTHHCPTLLHAGWPWKTGACCRLASSQEPHSPPRGSHNTSSTPSPRAHSRQRMCQTAQRHREGTMRGGHLSVCALHQGYDRWFICLVYYHL